MGEQAKTVLAVGAGGLIATAVALLAARKASAGTGAGGEVSLDDAAMNLLLAVAESGTKIDDSTFKALAELAGIREDIDRLAAALGISVLENPSEITAFRIQVPVINIPVQLPDRVVPYDMDFVIKALPNNLGLIWVANSRAEAMNINSVYQLLANEAIEYKIKNSQQLWINATRANEGVVCTVEQRGRG